MKALIHFTDTFSKLNSIVKTSSLSLKYCQEEFSLGKEKISQATHPMVCFSKYDIDRLQEMKITYGRYGIAFSDEWVKKSKVHQVIYIDKESALAGALAKLLRARQNQEDSKLPNNLRLPIMTIKCFTKNARGYNKPLKVIDFNFAEENEWRFVPEKKDIGKGLISQNLSTYLKDKESHNRKLTPYPLKFAKSDILKIFVSGKNEIELLVNHGIERDLIQLSKWRI